MRHNVWVSFLLFLGVMLAHADYTLHLQSPWRDDPPYAKYAIYILGEATVYWGTSETNQMKPEGDSWFSFTFEGEPSKIGSKFFEVQACIDTTDNNVRNGNCKTWSSGRIVLSALFGTDNELWLYTESNDGSYAKSFVAPGSKMVWFKSPWGNKALPQMIFGRDSILMRFDSNDESKCGWFYGAISPAVLKANPAGTAHFIRYKAPYISKPSAGVIELSDALDASDTIYIDGTADELTPAFEMGSLGECFDPSRVLHIYHPWRNNSTFKDSLVYISIQNNILNNATATLPDEKYPYWFKYAFADSLVSSSSWNSSQSLFNIYRRQNEWPLVTFFSNETRPMAAEIFPMGVYETWLYTKTSGGFEFLFAPLEPKTVRLMSPWDNMSPAMIVADDTVKLGPIAASPFDTTQSDTCGWYQGTYYKHTNDWSVQFKQSFGMEYYSLEGLMGEDGGMGTPISLDSMMALYDTVWVYPYPLSSSAPRFSDFFPGRLGICPTMKISAMLLDWAGESYADSIDVDFGGIYGGNAYTTINFPDTAGTLQTYKTCGGHVLGMVQDTLSNLGLPMRVDSLDFPWEKCSAGREIDKWFIPEVVAKGPDGKEYTNATCRDIDLKLDEEGFWLADVTESPNGCNDPVNPGFYPLDDFEYLDSAKTIKNPKFDWDVQGCKHNYSFSMKISAQFKYVKGQYFEFRGDDDVWVFINDHLVVDIGGCHSPVEGAVDLDTLGLVEGKEYPFQIFFSERNATGSNFKMRTSINLQTQKTYFPVQKMNAAGVIEYELLQLLIDESLSCDVSSVSKIDTTYAQSVFTLMGGSLPKEGILLEPGLNYGGIWISENMAGFSVDTSAFVNSRLLEPGKYVLICALASDQSQYQMIAFTVPEYPLPDIAFVDVFTPSDSLMLLDPMGMSLRGEFVGDRIDTLLAHVAYPDTVPLKIALLFGSRPCGEMDSDAMVNCKVSLEIHTKDAIGFLDVNKKRISELTTDSLGYAQFYVVGDSAVSNGSFAIYGNGVANALQWNYIYFKEPPVPFASVASIYDANGDGIADSLVIPFNKPFEDVVPDTISWNFGGSEFNTVAGMDYIKLLVSEDSIITLYKAEGIKSDVFTGLADRSYEGTLMYHYTYRDKDSGEEVKLEMNTSIDDKIAPIVIGATVEVKTDEVSVLTVKLSEGTAMRDLGGDVALEVYRDTTLISSQLLVASTMFNKQGNVMTIYYSRSGTGVIPSVGDYVRLTPGVLKDRSDNAAHISNPKVRIVGEQRTEIKAPGVINISSESEWHYENPIIAVSVPRNKDVKDIIDSLGMPGLLMNFDIGELATSIILNLPAGADRDSALGLIKIGWEGYYFSHLGNFVNNAKGFVYCNDKTVFYNANDPENSNCYDNPGNIFFEWNARSENGRLVGTGAYITKMKVKVYAGENVMGDSEDTYTIGIKRGK